MRALAPRRCSSCLLELVVAAVVMVVAAAAGVGARGAARWVRARRLRRKSVRGHEEDRSGCRRPNPAPTAADSLVYLSAAAAGL